MIAENVRMSSISLVDVRKAAMKMGRSGEADTGPQLQSINTRACDLGKSQTTDHAKVGGRRWYVFRSAARQEALAEANLTYQAFTHFLPKLLVTKRHAQRFITHREWLFPRYGFVSFDITRDRWRSINGTFGVERLIMGNDGPQPVPSGIIEGLQACLNEQGVFDFDAGLKPGVEIRVNQGPLAGALGVLTSLDSKGRAELLLELMNGQVRAKLEREWIETVA